MTIDRRLIDTALLGAYRLLLKLAKEFSVISTQVANIGMVKMITHLIGGLTILE